MDLNDLRSAVTVLGLLIFLAIVGWAWQRSRAADFAAAARLPLEDSTGAAPQRKETQ
jgi:cytochrome c oxidase cbb3-type subunit IV